VFWFKTWGQLSDLFLNLIPDIQCVLVMLSFHSRTTLGLSSQGFIIFQLSFTLRIFLYPHLVHHHLLSSSLSISMRRNWHGIQSTFWKLSSSPLIHVLFLLVSLDSWLENDVLHNLESGNTHSFDSALERKIFLPILLLHYPLWESETNHIYSTWIRKLWITSHWTQMIMNDPLESHHPWLNSHSLSLIQP
jgi:hypothetical protein